MISASHIIPRKVTSVTLNTNGTQLIGVLIPLEEFCTQYIYSPRTIPLASPKMSNFNFHSVSWTCECSPYWIPVSSSSAIMRLDILSTFSVLFLPALVSGQLSGHVGPTTTRDAKRSKKVCNVLDYGGVASKTSDIGPPVVSAFAACKTGGTGNFYHARDLRILMPASLHPSWRLWNEHLGQLERWNWMGSSARWHHLSCGVRPRY